MTTAKRIARPAEHTLRHLWLAGLGLGAVTGRQAAHVRELARRIAAVQAQAARQAMHRLGEQVPNLIRERIPRPLRKPIHALGPGHAMASQSPPRPQGRALQVPASKAASPVAAPVRKRQASPVRTVRKGHRETAPPRSSSRSPSPESTAGTEGAARIPTSGKPDRLG